MDEPGPFSKFFSSLTSTPGRIAATLGGAALVFAVVTPLVFKDWAPISKIPMNWSKDADRTVELPAGAFSRRGQASGESLKMLRGEGLFAPKPGLESGAAAAPGQTPTGAPPGHTGAGTPPAPGDDGALPPVPPPPGLKPGLSNSSSGGRGGGGGFVGSGGGATAGLGRSDAGTTKTSDAWRGTDEHYVTGGKRGAGAKGGAPANGGVGGTSAANAAEGAPGELDGISAAESGGLMGIAPPAPKTKNFGGSANGGGGGAAGGGGSSEGGDAGDSTGDSAKCVAARQKWGPILSFYESEAIKFERQFAQNCGGSYSRSACGNPWLHYCNYNSGIWAAVYQKYCSCAHIRCKANGAKKNMDKARCGIAAGCPAEPC